MGTLIRAHDLTPGMKVLTGPVTLTVRSVNWQRTRTLVWVEFRETPDMPAVAFSEHAKVPVEAGELVRADELKVGQQVVWRGTTEPRTVTGLRFEKGVVAVGLNGTPLIHPVYVAYADELIPLWRNA